MSLKVSVIMITVITDDKSNDEGGSSNTFDHAIQMEIN